MFIVFLPAVVDALGRSTGVVHGLCVNISDVSQHSELSAHSLVVTRQTLQPLRFRVSFSY